MSVTRDYLGYGALFTPRQGDYLKTFSIYHGTDPYDYNSSYASRWEEIGNHTLGITEWLKSLKERKVGSFEVMVSQRELEKGDTKVDAWLDFPYCHDLTLVSGIGSGGRWVGGSLVTSNCILANLPLGLVSYFRGLKYTPSKYSRYKFHMWS